MKKKHFIPQIQKMLRVFLKKKIKNLRIDEIETIFKKLTKQFKFNVYEISDDLDVFIAFETMNNRGKNYQIQNY